MKLMRMGAPGQERPAILGEDGIIRDLSSIVPDIGPETITPAGLDRIRQADLSALPAIDPSERIGPCLARPGKFLCIGLNFADHAAETNAPIPEEPILFTKATTAICGPNDDILRPRDSTKLDWEVELAFVIGKVCRYASPEEAREAIAGYLLCNDVSERSFQMERGGTWDKGKGCDTFGPIGPWVATADEIANPLDLGMWLEVNGHRYQQGSSRTMIFDPYYLVSYVSRFMTLEPGDIITTGTPPGVGLGQTPPVYLQPGDRIRLGIDGLGEQNQTVFEAP